MTYIKKLFVIIFISFTIYPIFADRNYLNRLKDKFDIIYFNPNTNKTNQYAVLTLNGVDLDSLTPQSMGYPKQNTEGDNYATIQGKIGAHAEPTVLGSIDSLVAKSKIELNRISLFSYLVPCENCMREFIDKSQKFKQVKEKELGYFMQWNRPPDNKPDDALDYRSLLEITKAGWKVYRVCAKEEDRPQPEAAREEKGAAAAAPAARREPCPTFQEALRDCLTITMNQHFKVRNRPEVFNNIINSSIDYNSTYRDGDKWKLIGEGREMVQDAKVVSGNIYRACALQSRNFPIGPPL